MAFAFDEFQQWVGRIHDPLPNDPNLRYVCALLSDLAYCHVPQYEIDGGRRVNFVPSDEYQRIILGRHATSIFEILRATDFQFFILDENRYVIVIGVIVNNILFLAMRGTQFLFDWKINFRAFRPRPIDRIPWLETHRFHPGFAAEAIRVVPLIYEEIAKRKLKNINKIFVTGHSLGAAIAGISQELLRYSYKGAISVLFACPRFCCDDHIFSELNGVDIRIPGDVIPSMPAKMLGYADVPNEHTPDGREFVLHGHFPSRLALFVQRMGAQHKMGLYRREVGMAVGSPLASAPVASYPTLEHSDIANMVDPRAVQMRALLFAVIVGWMSDVDDLANGIFRIEDWRGKDRDEVVAEANRLWAWLTSGPPVPPENLKQAENIISGHVRAVFSKLLAEQASVKSPIEPGSPAPPVTL